LQLLDRYELSGTLLAQVRAHNDSRCDTSKSKAMVNGFAQMWHDYGLGNPGGLHQPLDVARLTMRRCRWTSAKLRPLEGWYALTETEERVALLIADGHTNRSAAERLVLSPNTVATHLRSIFGKLAVTSRSQLTRVVMNQANPKR
jgi:DNA-binding CsgD family transcriptional regulator